MTLIALITAPKWLLRQKAIAALSAYVDSGQPDSSGADDFSSSLLVVVKENTKGFKETNVNIMKAILQLFLSICNYHESIECQLCEWAAKDGVAVATQKIFDRKLSVLSKSLLTALCVVCQPHIVIDEASLVLKNVKAPAAHEEFQKWFKTFCSDFGASCIGPSVASIVPWLLEVRNNDLKYQRFDFCLTQPNLPSTGGFLNQPKS